MGVAFFFQAEDGIRDADVTGVQTCALPIARARPADFRWRGGFNRTAPEHDRPRWRTARRRRLPCVGTLPDRVSPPEFLGFTISDSWTRKSKNYAVPPVIVTEVAELIILFVSTASEGARRSARTGGPPRRRATLRRLGRTA